MSKKSPQPSLENQQGETDQYKILNDKIKNLENSILQTKGDFEKKLDYQMCCNETAINSVNTSLNGASHIFMALGIVVSVLLVFLSIYITWQVRNVTLIKEQSERILDTHKIIRDEVKVLDEKITHNVTKLYYDLKDAETKALVEKLNENPESILVYNAILSSGKIPKELYPQFKKAYQSLRKDNSAAQEAKEVYLTLFLVRFPDLSIFDEDLQSLIEDSFSSTLSRCLKVSILNISEELIKGTIKDGNILNFSTKIKKYFHALKSTAYINSSEMKEIHEHIYKTLFTKENRFIFYTILKQEPRLKDFAVIYGQFLLADYKSINDNTDEQKKILFEISGIKESVK